jgi:hypothetical protein
MNIVDYDVIKSDTKILIFIKIEECPNQYKLRYKTLSNILYELSSGWCIADRRGKALAIRDDLISCQEFLNEKFSNEYEIEKKLILVDAN